jgi:hypothetical protein
MKKLITMFCIALLSLSSLLAVDMALSLGTFSFSPSFSSVDQGLYSQMGLIAGIPDRLEAEFAVVSQVTPDFAKNVLVKTSLSYALLSPLYKGDGFVPMYINSFIGVGVLAKVPSLDSWGPFITLVPLASGGPQFMRKERVGSLSLYYDVPLNSFGMFFQIFSIDLFFTHNN